MRTRYVTLWLIPPMTLLAAVSVWAYLPFEDMDYAGAWWTLTWLAEAPLPVEDPLSMSAAIAIAILSAAVVGLILFLALSGNPSLRLLLAALGALCWFSSPWQAATLQYGGALAYSWLLPPLAGAALARSFWPRWAFVATLAVVLSLLAVQYVALGWQPLLNPVAIMLPEPGALSPWRMHGDQASGTALCELLLGVLIVMQSMRLFSQLGREVLLPSCLVLLLLPAANAMMLSEQIQVRANPRLALLYSLAYSDPAPATMWLASEYFEMLGDKALAGRYLREAQQHSLDGLPEDYRLALDCVRGILGDASATSGSANVLLLQYLRYHERCD